MKCLDLLEEKLGVRFEGKTGNDLRNFILDNYTKLGIKVNLDSLCYDSEEFDNKTGFFINCNRKVLKLLKDKIASRSIINITNGFEYPDIDTALKGSAKGYNLRVNFCDQGEFNSLGYILTMLKRISAEAHEEIKLFFNSQYRMFNQWHFDIYKGYNRQSFVIYTNNNVEMLNSYLELASRCNDANLEDFIKDVICEIRVTRVEVINDYFNMD